MTARRPLGSTYRLQLNGMGFAEATRAVPFLADLGVQTCYVSPIGRARPGSGHGYDVIDPTVLDPSLGTPEEFEGFLAALAAHGMSLLVDIVPNHMAASLENRFFRDVLRLGRQSEYADYFDIAWSEQGGRVLLPVLGRPLMEAIAAGEVAISRRDGEPVVRHLDQAYPIDPASYHLTVDALVAQCRPDRPSGRTALASLLGRQHFRLAYWRVASQELNYRRFFDISELIAVRQEDPAVFAATHRLVVDLARDPRVAGLRVDHVDGLADPQSYLEALRTATATVEPAPVVLVEKILDGDERLPSAWPVDGTTGYEFAAAVTGLFIDIVGADELAAAASSVTGDARTFAARALDAKRRAIETLFPHQLGQVVDAFARAIEDELGPLDLTTPDVAAAVIELTATLPVYRTYRRAGTAAEPDDVRRIRAAATSARRRLTPEAGRALDAVVTVSTGGLAEGSAALHATTAWQQLTGPVAAKGVEDTALYGSGRLLAAAEVGAAPDHPAVDPERFHVMMRDRSKRTQSGLSATSTHDTKRSEDVRSRLAVLSEIAPVWEAAVARISTLADRRAGDRSARPDAADQRYILETLVGAWPADGVTDQQFAARIREHLTKAAREAKRHSSWHEPNVRYERALGAYASRIIRGTPPELRRQVEGIVAKIECAGITNSLASVVLKLAAPGIPDVYQGTDTWAFTLTDPDNRNPVDFDRHRARLAQLPDVSATGDHSERVDALLMEWRDGRIKQHVLRQGLRCRRAHAALFREGRYEPLNVRGPHRSHVVAFARVRRDRWVVAVVPRLAYRLVGPRQFPVGPDCWDTTAVSLPSNAPRDFTDVLTGAETSVRRGGLATGSVLGVLPVALLEGRVGRVAST